MDDHDIIEATTASGVDVSAGTREAIRGNLVRAIGGEHVVPPTSIRARTRRPSVARWGAAGLAAAAVIAVAVVVVTLDRSRQIGPVAPDTSSQPDASSGPLVPPATSLVAVPDTSATTTASSA
ncbi:MAG: hypothetical protein JWL72_378, partial [Ilumatobacteraceae bacterium]|nr:hypothetical protein [Ilumatobacteraceae bacterium]